MKKLIFICIIATLLTGCQKGISQEKYNEVFNNLQTLRTEHTELKNQYQELENKLDNLIKYDVYVTNNFAYQIPTTWTTSQIDDNIYYYPESGLLMIQIATLDKEYINLTSTEIDELLTSFEDGVKESSVNYEKISSKLTYVDTNIVARELVYYCDYENEKYENKAVSFIHDGNLSTFIMAQANQLEDIEIFDEIILSIKIIK